MIALKTGSRDFVLLPEHKMDAIRLKETGFVGEHPKVCVNLQTDVR